MIKNLYLHFLENLFTQNYKRLCYFAFKVVNDRDVAEDIVQDVFEKIWVDKLDFSKIKNLDAYLYIAVKNRSISYLRRNKNITEISLADIEIESSQMCMLEHISTAEMLQTINECVNSLPTQCSKVMSFLLLGYNCEEIAKELSLASSSIRAHKAQGIKLMKKKLSNALVTFLL